MRGISDETLQSVKASIITENIVSFPIFSVYGLEVGAILYNATNPRKYNTLIKDGKPHLFNEQALPDLFYGKGAVVAVEGVFDALSLIQEGVVAVAMNTNNLKSGILETISRYTDKLVIWPDSDSYGEAGLEFTKKRLKYHPSIQLRVFKCNDEKDANDLLVRNNSLFLERVKQLKQLMTTF